MKSRRLSLLCTTCQAICTLSATGFYCPNGHGRQDHEKQKPKRRTVEETMNEPVDLTPKFTPPRNMYREALQIQDACNSSGVARFLVECFDFLRTLPEYDKVGTSWCNKHPLIRAVISKLESLAGGTGDTAGTGPNAGDPANCWEQLANLSAEWEGKQPLKLPADPRYPAANKALGLDDPTANLRDAFNDAPQTGRISSKQPNFGNSPYKDVD